jgi:hypothetical protein
MNHAFFRLTSVDETSWSLLNIHTLFTPDERHSNGGTLLLSMPKTSGNPHGAAPSQPKTGLSKRVPGLQRSWPTTGLMRPPIMVNAGRKEQRESPPGHRPWSEASPSSGGSSHSETAACYPESAS